MKKFFIHFLFVSLLLGSCSKEDDTVLNPATGGETGTEETSDLEIEKFIYGAMNEIYLYKADVPELADAYFTSKAAKETYLASFDTPEGLFYDLVSDQDRFSLIIDNYERLENLLVGIDESNGMNYGLGRISGTNDRFGYIRYVLPGTSAEAQGLKRGDIFTEVNGVQISDSNYRDLLFSGESYTINVGRIVNGSIEMTEQTVSLTGQEYSENPIFTTNVIQREGRTIGYLKYNGFYGTPEYDTQLNAVFGDFKAQGVTDLVLDLRYNGGGYVETAIDLASMITGQFEGQVALREQWNEKYQNAWPEESYITRFDNRIRTGEQINSLNLSQVYVLATYSSASASELVMNTLEAYIDVVHIGENTHGKFQASAPIYDSPNLSKTDNQGQVHVNPNHKYALLPLIFKYANANGRSDFVDGLIPDIYLEEDLGNYGVLGDPDERFFKAAINDILGYGQGELSTATKQAESEFKFLGESKMFDPTFNKMYLEKLPEEIMIKD